MLRVCAEGASFEHEADLTASAEPTEFFAWAGGGDFFDEEEDEPPPRRPTGPLTWPEALDIHLRPNRWLELGPALIHPAIAELVRAELPSASRAGAARWADALARVRGPRAR